MSHLITRPFSTESCTPSKITDKELHTDTGAETEGDGSGQIAVIGQPKRTGSSIGAYLNIICVIIGVGALNLPKTLQQSGWIGLLLIGIGSFVGTLSSVLVIRALNLIDNGQLRNFNQIGYAAFGTPGRTVIYIFLLIYVVGVVGDYIILSGQNFHQLTRDSGHDIGEAAWKVICATIMWLACISLKQMSEAFLLSLFGFLTSIVTILIAVTLSCMYPYRSNGAVPVEHRPAVHRVADGPGVAIAMATITFAFCGVSVMPSIESSMRRPKQWNAVMGSAMGTVTGTYLLVGIVGYWAFGDQVLSPFLDNLPQNAATKAAKVLISLHVILAAPIIAASFAFELENALGITCEQLGRVKELVYRVLFRTMFFAAMTGVALGIPYFGSVMALVGAFSTSLMVCVIPVVCYLKLKGWRYVKWHMRVLSAAVIALGMYTCVFGAKGAIEDLRADIGHGK
ncbi:hypothetical protein LPJ66_005223 [Kickxella alabastrina]|uniref:Uncharacterized protein n=1 Tax=Kickxella alabastrina TaxID=61397 RepID=A0ACC1IGJ2_9FUNG|nr:hypothetical protein LPJ66_005223 [Kickxella alabastrina]